MSKNTFMSNFLITMCLVCSSAAPVAADSADAGVRQDAQHTVLLLNDSARKLNRISSVMTRLTASIDDLIERRTRAAVSCRDFWQSATQLESCLIRQFESLEGMGFSYRGCLSRRDELVTTIADAGSESMGEEDFRFLQNFVATRGEVLSAFDRNILREVRSRYDAGVARYAELAPRPSVSASRARQEQLFLRNEMRLEEALGLPGASHEK